MSEQKMIDDMSEELDQVRQMGGDVDPLNSDDSEETSGEDSDTEETEDQEDTKKPDSDEEEGSDTSETSEEGEADEEPPAPQKKPKTPDTGKATDRFNRSRGNLRTKVDGIEASIQEILTALKTGKISKPDADAQVQDELDSYAEKHKLDPDGIKELVGIIEKRLKPAAKPAEEAISEDDAESDEAIEYNAEEEAQIFDEQWVPLETKIREQYPNASPKQIVEAKRKMDEIAHSSAQLAEQDLDYIYSKFPKTFSQLLFSPKKKGAESGFLGTTDEEAESKDFKFDSNTMTPKKAEALEAQLNELSEAEEEGGLEIMRDGEKINV